MRVLITWLDQSDRITTEPPSNGYSLLDAGYFLENPPVIWARQAEENQAIYAPQVVNWLLIQVQAPDGSAELLKGRTNLTPMQCTPRRNRSNLEFCVKS